MQAGQQAIPFDAGLLDRLMEGAGMDVLLATSKPAVQYLLGGYRFHFFEHADAIGQSRYLPVLAYCRGQPDRAFYVGHPLEKFQQAVEPLWVPEARNTAGTSVDAMRQAVEHLRSRGIASPRIGIEQPFLPADALAVLRDAYPNGALPDATPVLERLRAVKTEAEIGMLRLASDRVIDAMLAVMQGHAPGTTKRELVEALRREEVARGLEFDYCLITAGTSLNRAPSDQRWEAGDILSLDSGGHYLGYIGDVCRMAIQGEPDAELRDLLAEVDAVQQAAFAAVRAGAPGQAVYDAAGAALRDAPNRDAMEFLAHGMGLVSHEVPHLTGTGPIPYAAEDADRPLQPNMVLSIETTLLHKRRGFIKLEDTVVVRAGGYEILGDKGRGWNRGGIGAG